MTGRHGDRYWQGIRLQRMSPVQWLIAGLLLTGIVLFARWQNSQDLNARTSVVRALLELPEGAVFSDIQRLNKSARTTPSVAVIAQLSASDMEAYLLRLEKPLWVRSIPSFGDAPLQPISPGSIKWRSLPVPASVGNSGVGWSSLSARAVSGIRNGRMLCVALQDRQTAQGHSSATRPAREFTARDCMDVPRTDESLTVVLGALDFETRTLHVMIK
jgi:hypothetical protein